jgi:hypothetical protein
MYILCILFGAARLGFLNLRFFGVAGLQVSTLNVSR